MIHGTSFIITIIRYSAFANNGMYTKPRFYTKVLDRDGNVLIENTAMTKMQVNNIQQKLLINY